MLVVRTAQGAQRGAGPGRAPSAHPFPAPFPGTAPGAAPALTQAIHARHLRMGAAGKLRPARPAPRSGGRRRRMWAGGGRGEGGSRTERPAGAQQAAATRAGGHEQPAPRPPARTRLAPGRGDAERRVPEAAARLGPPRARTRRPVSPARAAGFPPHPPRLGFVRGRRPGRCAESEWGPGRGARMTLGPAPGRGPGSLRGWGEKTPSPARLGGPGGDPTLEMRFSPEAAPTAPSPAASRAQQAPSAASSQPRASRAAAVGARRGAVGRGDLAGRGAERCRGGACVLLRGPPGAPQPRGAPAPGRPRDLRPPAPIRSRGAGPFPAHGARRRVLNNTRGWRPGTGVRPGPGSFGAAPSCPPGSAGHAHPVSPRPLGPGRLPCLSSLPSSHPLPSPPPLPLSPPVCPGHPLLSPLGVKVRHSPQAFPPLAVLLGSREELREQDAFLQCGSGF